MSTYLYVYVYIHERDGVSGVFLAQILKLNIFSLNTDTENKSLPLGCKILCPTLISAVIFLQQQTYRNLDQGLSLVISFVEHKRFTYPKVGNNSRFKTPKAPEIRMLRYLFSWKLNCYNCRETFSPLRSFEFGGLLSVAVGFLYLCKFSFQHMNIHRSPSHSWMQRSHSKSGSRLEDEFGLTMTNTCTRRCVDHNSDNPGTNSSLWWNA